MPPFPPPNDPAYRPVILDRSRYTPKPDDMLTISLPGEILRAKVAKVHGADTVIVEITAVPMAKTHQYRKGDVVAVRREIGDHGIERWGLLTDRQLQMAAEAERAAQYEETRRRAAEEAAAEEAKPKVARKRREKTVA